MSFPVKRVFSSVKYVFIAFALSLFMVIISFYYSSISFDETDILDIKIGSSLNEVITQLEKEFDFQSSFRLKIMMKLLFLEDEIKPGKHNLGNVKTIKSLINELTIYPESLIDITILEGWNLNDIAYYLEKKLKLFNSTKFLKLCKNKDFINKELIVKLGFYDVSTLEGYVYPDTYTVDEYLSEKELIIIFIKEFLLETESFKNDITNEVMIIASIIEAETNLSIEMDTISSVYNNRVKRSMRLESDPTILFYMKDSDLKIFKNSKHGTGEFRKVWNKYKKMDNPYNTYKYLMPPGPINSPGLSAIKAALNPAKTNYLYMVMNNKLGKHLFSDDYKGHTKNIEKNKKGKKK